MGLEIVTGRAGSGKSRDLLRRIGRLIKDPFARILVIVPAQLTFETEKRILTDCGAAGILGLEVLSIQRLAFRILEETGGAAFMTGAEKAMAAHLALRAFDAPFGGSGHLPDFEACLSALFTQLKSHRQTPDSLRDAARRTADKALRAKLIQTADIYGEYIAVCGSRLDMADMYALAAARAEKAAFLRGAHVFIDGLDSYAPAVMELLSQVMARARHTWAAFRAEGDGADAELFAAQKRDRERLAAAAARRGLDVVVREPEGQSRRHTCAALRFLEQNLYRYPYAPFLDEPDGVSVAPAESLEQEVAALAAGIRGEVRRGKRFRDIAVVGGGLSAYLPAIKSAFAQCGIPYFIDERRTLADNPFFSYLYSALCAAAGDMTATPGYVYSDYAPISGAERIALADYAQRYACKGWHYFGAFRRGAGAADMEALRRRLMRPLTTLADGLQQPGVRAQVQAVRQFLTDCGAAGKIEALCEGLGDQDTAGERAYFAQVYEKSLEVLEGVERIASGRALSPKALCGLLKTGFMAVKIAVIPPTTDEVRLFDISAAQLPGVDVLFAIGVHDGVMPARDGGFGILSAAERDALRGIGLDIGGYDLAEEKQKVYTAFSQPRERLIVSYNAQTGQPSVLIDRIKRLFPKLQKPAPPPVLLAGTEADVLCAVGRVLRGGEPDERLPGVLAYHLQKPGWRERAGAVLLRTNAAVPLTARQAKALYGNMRSSATRIENFCKCPYKHFLDHGLRAQALRDYEHDRVDIGAFMHLGLDIFTKTLLADRIDIKTLTAGHTESRMRAAAAEAAARHDDGKLLDDERFSLTRAQLVRELVDTAQRIRRHFADSGASVFASECDFEYALPTAQGRVTVTGKIDRIDTAGGYFRVVDYKSSAAKFDADALAAGTALQLPVYIDAARRILEKEGLRPAGGYYMRIGETYHESEDKAGKDARMHGLSLADAQALSGFCAVLPDGGFAAIDQAVTASGGLNGRGAARLFSADEMDALLRFTGELIGSAAGRMYGGETDISPTREACGLCGYAGVCRINAEYEGNTVRAPKRFDRALLAGGDT